MSKRLSAAVVVSVVLSSFAWAQTRLPLLRAGSTVKIVSGLTLPSGTALREWPAITSLTDGKVGLQSDGVMNIPRDSEPHCRLSRPRRSENLTAGTVLTVAANVERPYRPALFPNQAVRVRVELKSDRGTIYSLDCFMTRDTQDWLSKIKSMLGSGFEITPAPEPVSAPDTTPPAGSGAAITHQ